ncbi:MAG: extracellular solute-binding protein [Lachnospiraceae bacterium]|nr:extracellular solute-binding protein [Lachnospiraceae bacterium]
MNGKWKKGAGILLALITCVGMAACGGKNREAEKAEEMKQAANAQMAKEGVYQYRELPLTVNGGELRVVAGRNCTDGAELITNSEGGSAPELSLSVVKADGSLESEAFLTFPELQTDEIMDPDGNPVEIQYESVICRNAALTEKMVYAVGEISREYELDGEYQSDTDYYVLSWDKGGKLLWSGELELDQYQNDDAYSSMDQVMALEDGSLGILMIGDVSGLIIVKEDGTIQELKQLKAAREVLEKSPNISVGPDGSWLFFYYSDDWTRQYAVSYDPLKDQLGTPVELPETMRNHSEGSKSIGINGEILYVTSDGLYGYKLGDTDVKKKMDFINSDLDTTYLDSVLALDEERFFGVYEDWNDNSSHACIFTYVRPADVKEKKTLVYGCIDIEPSEKSNVIQFNRSNSEYRIVVKDYSEAGDYESARTRLNNDILAGAMPDILRLNYSMPMESFASKGLLADIDELIKKDPELGSMEYADNVFEAYRLGGKLYQVIPYFSVRTWIGKKSILGDRSGITMEEVGRLSGKLADQKQIFGGGKTRDAFLYTIMQYCGSDFVDLNTGKCEFNTKLFADLLEYAKNLPDSEQGAGLDDEYWEEYWNTYYMQYRENKALLLECFVREPWDLKTSMQGMIGEEAVFCGFPTEKGNGSFIELELSYAISAKSANLDGAWQYLRTYLSKDYQRNLIEGDGYKAGIPVWKELIREETDAMTQQPFWVNENGQKEYYDETYGLGDEVITLEPLTQEEADGIFEFICSVSKPEYGDDTVMNIVSEEAGAFFAGSKSAKEVTEMIQNRVQLYVNENR